MRNCIFNSHCTEYICDASCPIFAETNYLLERNGITIQNKVFQASEAEVANYMPVIESENGLVTLVAKDTTYISDLVAYAAICKYWRGNRLHCSVYSLQYSQYLDMLKQSWAVKSAIEDLEYEKIWIKSSKILVISNLDYVNFGDFESQTLLNIIQSRKEIGKHTIIVSPPLQNLVKKPTSIFYSRLYDLLKASKQSVKEVSHK